MTQVNAKPLQQQGNSRERLLREAAKLFMQQGYERTTMRTIAEVTGIKLGSISYYFKSKEDILYEAMKAIVLSGEERALDAVKNSSTGFNKLRALIEVELVSFINESGAIVIKEWRCLPQKHQDALLEHRQTYENLWLEVLTECTQQGIIRTQPEIARRFIHGAFAWSETWFSSTGNLDIKGLSKEVINLITQAPRDI